MRERKTNSLRDFQTNFVDALFAKNPNESMAKSIIPAGKLADGLSALKVHSRGYICRLTEALGECYRGVWSVLGDEEFFSIGKAYILSHPSNFYNLNNYGRDFPDFLKAIPSKTDFPFLSDLAKFERAFSDCFHKEDHEPLKPADLARIEHEPSLKLTFGPSVMFLAFDFAVYEIWKGRFLKKRTMPELFGPEHLALYKHDGQMFVHQLTKHEYELLSLLHSGAPINACLENIQGLKPEDVSAVFYFLASAGLVVAIDE